MKRPAEVKKIAEAESLAPSGLKTYTRSSDGATMVEIAPHSFLNAEHLALGSGRSRAAGR
jgi:hypothetical protein